MRAEDVRDKLESMGTGAFLREYGRYYLVLTATESLEDVAAEIDQAEDAGGRDDRAGGKVLEQGRIAHSRGREGTA